MINYKFLRAYNYIEIRRQNFLWLVRVMVFTVVIPNLGMWVFGKVSGVARPFWDVDYFMASVAVVLLGRPVGAAVLFLALVQMGNRDHGIAALAYDQVGSHVRGGFFRAGLAGVCLW
jgi:hypothetical protein